MARLKILEHMKTTLAGPKEMSIHAPRMVTVQIPIEKIGALIGPGGKNIRRIIEETGAEVEVEDDGRYISPPKILNLSNAPAPKLPV